MSLFTILAGDIAVEPGNIVFVRNVQVVETVEGVESVKIVEVVKIVETVETVRGVKNVEVVEAVEVSGWRSEVGGQKSVFKTRGSVIFLP